jgi:hypothetical protein
MPHAKKAMGPSTTYAGAPYLNATAIDEIEELGYDI